MKLSEFTYELPKEKIAQFPLEKRDNAKLLVYKGGKITDSVFSKLPAVIPDDSFLVLNESKVIHARLYFPKVGGKDIEIFLLSPHDPKDIHLSLGAKKHCIWECYVGNLRRWKDGILTHDGVNVRRISTDNDVHLVEFTYDGVFSDVIQKHGHVPLPPYMKRDDAVTDEAAYQTVFASSAGSVAAPTAGLHYTKSLLTELSKKTTIGKITLHVGAGTFRPIQVDDISKHAMHSEAIEVSAEFIESLAAAVSSGKTIVCAGTTSLRTLESLYWVAVHIHDDKPLDVLQDNPPSTLSVADALSILKKYVKTHKIIYTTTSLFITPGYSFKFATALQTNFHVPKSTLLVLVAAFIGDDWKKVYSHALSNDYRFLSYGDTSLLFRNTHL
ncbi:MAG TPA: S-adenosylmethionine:tRNA ribosyltransferase-isomerase [Acidobacteriota bacterium]|nr:S-adenosylmethionine:tRNA ribosyltransferase-isomerase [Acidobacteriota bacterium]